MLLLLAVIMGRESSQDPEERGGPSVYLDSDDQLAHVGGGVGVLSKWLDCRTGRNSSNGSGEQLDQLGDG
jgi:hypothetical protein